MGPIERRIQDYADRVRDVQARGLYFYLQPVEVADGARVTVGGRTLLHASSYSYLGLLGHPAIQAAARAALDHASILDGCRLSGARLVRVPHNDIPAFDRALAEAPADAGRLVVVDAVFSMDGDVIALPALVEVCRRRHAWLMVDESHSLGVLGDRGQGIEAHFGLSGAVDVKMSSLSKSIPSAGGYIAGSEDLVSYLKHGSRPFVFSAALPPASAAAALAALEVMEAEPDRVARLRGHVRRLRDGLRAGGIPVRDDPTPIVPVITGDDEAALRVARRLHDRGIFALPILSPAVPPHTSRLRITVTAAHADEDVGTIVTALVDAWRAVMSPQAVGRRESAEC